MNDYISRDAAITAIGKPKVTPGGVIFDALKKACQEEVRNLPAADVQPVVYCKDCKHRFNYDICANRGDNWFCGYGERRADNG